MAGRRWQRGPTCGPTFSISGATREPYQAGNKTGRQASRQANKEGRQAGRTTCAKETAIWEKERQADTWPMVWNRATYVPTGWAGSGSGVIVWDAGRGVKGPQVGQRACSPKQRASDRSSEQATRRQHVPTAFTMAAEATTVPARPPPILSY